MDMTPEQTQLHVRLYDYLKEEYIGKPEEMGNEDFISTVESALEAIKDAIQVGEECDAHGAHELGPCPQCIDEEMAEKFEYTPPSDLS